MLTSEYWISELAALAGVSARTIRYYIQEGLLPQPEIRGKYAVFTDEYMHRLRLIKVLKDAYLPLNRIKELLTALNENELVSLLKKFEEDPISALGSLQALPVFEQQPANPPSLHTTRNENALNYINEVRSDRLVREKRNFTSQPDAQQQIPRFSRNAVQPEEEWRHVTLLPGLELHIRQPVSARVQRLVDLLLDLARKS